MKRESHQLRQTRDGNYLAPCYFLLALTKTTFPDSEGLEARGRSFGAPETFGASLLKNGLLRI